jgi:hypothetical protein
MERESNSQPGTEMARLWEVCRETRAWGKKKSRLQNCSSEGKAWGSNKSLIMKQGLGVKAEDQGGCPTMSAGTRQILQLAEQAQKRVHSNGDRLAS